MTTFFEPCYCGKCYNCAVKFVLGTICWNTDFTFLDTKQAFSQKECVQIKDEWVRAFAMAKAPHNELALQRLNSSGMTLKKVLTTIDRQQVDVTKEVLSGTKIGINEGRSVRWEPDIEKAAIELARKVKLDPISYDAALHLVAKQIRIGCPIPEVLREWAADTMIGIAQRPKQKGAYPNATLFRDRLIFSLIKEIVSVTNLKATSAKRENGRSACNAVVDGMKLLRLQPDSYEMIIKIWLQRKSLSMVSVPERV